MNDVEPTSERRSQDHAGTYPRLMLAVALILDRGDRARIRQAARQTGEVVFCDRREQLLSILTTCAPAILLTEPWDSTGAPTAPMIRAAKQAFPSHPAIVYLTLTPAACREVLRLAAAGADEIVIPGVDDVGSTLRSALLSAEARCGAVNILSALEPALHPDALPFVEHCLTHAREPLTVSGVADALGVHRKTLVNRMAAAQLPAPSILIGWCRLLIAARLLEDPGRTVEQVALTLDFGSGTALRNMFRRYTGLRASEVRQNGGLSCALHLFKRTLAHTGTHAVVE